MQVMRQDANITKANMQKLARATQVASEQAAKSLSRLGERFVRLGQITSFIFAVGMVKDFFTAGMGFQKAMSGVRAVSRGTHADFRMLGEQAKELGKTTVFTATQAAQAMEKLALSGLSVNRIYSIMPDVLNLAAAGELEIADAATIAVGTLFGFNMAAKDLSKAIDVMAWTASNSNQTIRDIGQSFTFVGSVASAAGLRFTEVNAALAMLANRNIRAERSGTALRRIVSILIGDLEKGEKGLAGFGLNITDADGKLISLADAIDAVNKAGAKLPDIMAEFQQRAGPAFLALMAAGGDAIRRFETALKLAGGTAEEIADIRLNNLQGRITLLTSAWRGLAVEVFERVEPALSDVATRATQVFRALSEDPETIQRIATTIKIVVKTLYNVLKVMIAVRALKFGATMLNNVRLISKGMGHLGGHFTSLGGQIGQTIGKLKFMGTIGVAAFGYITYEITRAILEMTGLNSLIQRAIMTMLESKADMRSYVESISSAVQRLRTLEELAGKPMGIKVGLQPEDLKQLEILIGLFWAMSGKDDKMGMRFIMDQIERFQTKLDESTGAYTRLNREAELFKLEQMDIWVEAGKGAKTYTEWINNAKEALAKAMEEDKKLGEERTKIEEHLKKIAEDASAFIDKTLEGVSLFRPGQLEDEREFFKQFAIGLGKDFMLIQGFAEGARDRVENFIKAHENLGEPIPEGLRQFVALLEQYIHAVEDSENRTEGMNEALETLKNAAAGAGLAMQSDIDVFAESFQRVEEAAIASGEGTTFAINAMAESIISMIDAARKAGNEVPEALAEVEDAARQFLHMEGFGDFFEDEMERMESRLDEFGEHWSNQWKRFGREITRTVGDTAAEIIIDQENLQESVERALKNLAKQAISMLIQWGLQKLFWNKVTKAGIITEHMANLAGYLAEVYASTFASISAIPIWGPAMAPFAAQTAVTTATAGAAAAGLQGSVLAGAITSLGGGAYAAGGITTREIRGATIGEEGPEAIIPLSGERARRAVKELGIGGDPGVTVVVNQTFTGDNWSEDGISENLMRAVNESLDDAIAAGKILAFRSRTI
jgi:TP901 family phage tail tape measure protein